VKTEEAIQISRTPDGQNTPFARRFPILSFRSTSRKVTLFFQKIVTLYGIKTNVKPWTSCREAIRNKVKAYENETIKL